MSRFRPGRDVNGKLWKTTVLLAMLTISIPSWAEEQEVAEAERNGMADFLWERDRSIRGMITVSYTHASDSEGPSTQGLRVGYGYLGGKANDYPWGEYWVTFRKNGAFDITAAGLSVAHVAKLNRRFGFSTLVDLGVSRRRISGRSAYAGMIGAGGEAVVRAFRRWDLVVTVEAVYRTTSETELQTRVGVRFHHEKIRSFRGDS